MTFTGMVLDVDARAVYVAEFPDDKWLDAVRGRIGCETVEAHTVWFDDLKYLVLCDEEGRLKDDPAPCVFDTANRDSIVGSAVVTGLRVSDDGDSCWEPRSMTNDEFDNLAEHLTGYLCDRRDGSIAFLPVLRGMSWTRPAGEE